MNLLKVFGNKRASSIQTEQLNNPDFSEPNWNSTGDVPFAGETLDPGEPDLIDPSIFDRRERKLIRALSWGDSSHFEILNEIPPEEYTRVLQGIKSGFYDDSFFRDIINHIPNSPEATNPENILSKLTTNKHFMRIMASVTENPDGTGPNFRHYQGISTEQIEQFQQQFPNPFDFETISNEFLDQIRALNTPEKYQEYVTDMEVFKKILYGRKQQYYESIKSLREKADTYAQISPDRSIELLRKVQIDGDPFPLNGEDVQLTPQLLAKNGLAPRYEIQLEKMKISLSKSFRTQGHDSIIAYIETPNGEVKTRSYYRSNSAGLWRYCPDYAYNSGHNIWYGKGYKEEALTLPFELQKRLDSITELGNIGMADRTTANLCFFGTAKRYTNTIEYDRARTFGELRGDYYQETKRQPSYEFYSSTDGKIPPEDLDITGPDAPDFHREISSYQSSTRLYGDYKVSLFPSNNDNLRFFMCETTKDNSTRAWLSNIETTAPIGSTGCRTEWVYMGDVGTPLYEYATQAGEYGDDYDVKGQYVSMWNKYLIHIQLIKDYLKETGKNQ